MKKEDNRIMRAAIEPVDGEDYDFRCIAVPIENKQLRYSFQNDEYFYQVLGTKEENIDVSRLASGIPLFDNHPYDVKAAVTLGISRGYEFTERGLELKIKLGARADEALREDIRNGILKTVSIEGEVVRYSITNNPGDVPTYFAEMWQPQSISLAPVPNDIDAQIEVKRAIAQKNVKPNYFNLICKNV